MPIYLHHANLIFDKAIISEKYQGGCEQFRNDWNQYNKNAFQEDDELFCIARWNMDEFDYELIKDRGLQCDNNKFVSRDFGAFARNEGLLWETPWLHDNTIFAWHVDCTAEQIERAQYIGTKITMDVIEKYMKKGIDLFDTIDKESIKITW